MNKRILFFPLVAALLCSCQAGIRKDGANIKSLYFDNVPDTAIQIAHFDEAGIFLHVDYSDRTSAEFHVTESWLPQEYLHFLGEPGDYSVSIYFRGKEVKLNFSMAENINAPTYRVTFLDQNEQVLDEYRLAHRKDALFHGQTPTENGYRFLGWDQSLYGVSQDMVYRPLFEAF